MSQASHTDPDSDENRRMTRENAAASAILQWVDSKITESEKALRGREQAAATFRSGDDASWAVAASMHPHTAGLPPMKKSERIRAADGQERIAAKCRHELEMLKGVRRFVAAPTNRQRLKAAFPDIWEKYSNL